jgi:hypothetical protein
MVFPEIRDPVDAMDENRHSEANAGFRKHYINIKLSNILINKLTTLLNN